MLEKGEKKKKWSTYIYSVSICQQDGSEVNTAKR